MPCPSGQKPSDRLRDLPLSSLSLRCPEPVEGSKRTPMSSRPSSFRRSQGATSLGTAGLGYRPLSLVPEPVEEGRKVGECRNGRWIIASVISLSYPSPPALFFSARHDRKEGVDEPGAPTDTIGTYRRNWGRPRWIGRRCGRPRLAAPGEPGRRHATGRGRHRPHEGGDVHRRRQ